MKNTFKDVFDNTCNIGDLKSEHIFCPQTTQDQGPQTGKFFICSDFLAESLVIRTYRDENLPFRKFQREKRLPKNSR